ncbi:AAA family ATPase, partial [bacterium]|nr:AAA family ATPase [bacterium]
MKYENLTVVIDRITYSNPQNGYMVLRTSCKEFPQGVIVVGNFGPLHPGEEIRVMGLWTNHPQFGSQFRSLEYKTVKPATLKGIEKYLGSGLIKGIGPVTAKRLVGAFGLETISVIEHNSEKLISCPGIGKVRAEKIITGWSAQQAIHDVMIFLQGNGISPAFATKIYKIFGADSISRVSENPYILATEISGIGFKTADRIAKEFGISGADPRRVEAGLQYLLFMALQDGHLFLTNEELKEKSLTILEIAEKEAILQALSIQIKKGNFVKYDFRDRELIYLPFAFRDEHGSVQRLGNFLQNPSHFDRQQLITTVKASMGNMGVTLSDQQQLAIEFSLKERFLILTGGPGTGKTTTLRAIVEAQQIMKRRVMLASPTGRAAKRLSEVTGREAKTIHRLLEFSPSDRKFKHDENDPLST